MGRKIQPRFHLVNDPNHMPRHACGIRDLVVAWFASGDGAHARVRGSQAYARGNLHGLPEGGVGLAQLAVGIFDHGSSLKADAD